MKHKLVLISLVVLLGIGCVVLLVGYVSHPAQAASNELDRLQTLQNSSGKDLSNSAGRVGPMVAETYTTYVPCVLKLCLPTYSDDFSNPTSGWTNQSGTGYSLGYINGEYRIATDPDWFAWTLRDFGTSNFQVELDTRPASAVLDGSGGIMFSADAVGFYLFELYDGWYALWSVDASSSIWQWTPLVNWTFNQSIHTGYATNHLKVVRNGATISIYANDLLLNTVSSSTHIGTLLGMASGAYDYFYDQRFDNFKLFTGSCIGVQGSVISENQAPSFGAIQLEQGSGHTKP